MQPAHENRPRPKPFSAENTKIIVCKVIFYYSLFYIVMKILAIFNNAWIIPNLLLCIPFAVFGIIGFRMTRENKYYWSYLILGILVISATRYFEKDLAIYFHQYL